MQMVLKELDEIVDVYDITYDKTGFPHFLIYIDGQWLRKSAKYFRPYSRQTLEDWISSTPDTIPLQQNRRN